MKPGTLFVAALLCLGAVVVALTESIGITHLSDSISHSLVSDNSGSSYRLGWISQRISYGNPLDEIDRIYKSYVQTDYFAIPASGMGDITPLGTEYRGIGFDIWK